MDKTAKDRMKRYRNKRRNETVTGTPENVTVDVTQYPAIIYALTDPIKRDKLDKVYWSLRAVHQEKNVYYGLPYNGISFDIIGEMLEVTR